tara:strand:- start:394 stop:1083 length:690 start_codon:yes stop_codon:yes gene_type:complete
MYLKKEFFLIFVTLLIINSCSTTNTKTIPPIAVTVETPNCPTSKCRLRYSTSSKIYDVTPPLPVIVEPLNADLYVACYDDRSQGNIKSIVVGTSYRKIIHPLDCSSNVITDVITDDTNNDEIKTETETEAEAETLENVVSLRKYIKKEKEVRSEKSSESPDQKGSNKDKLPSTEEENLNGETEESAEEREKKEKLAKEMMDQIDALYKQGLITKEAYEREKIIILNITK